MNSSQSRAPDARLGRAPCGASYLQFSIHGNIHGNEKLTLGWLVAYHFASGTAGSFGHRRDRIEPIGEFASRLDHTGSASAVGVCCRRKTGRNAKYRLR
ncbi:MULTISPECIES: hypothetical protein [unclassified Bradyrhizobium]|uniref:hypothetical protein n=1 Tax=unclassified Bradyrhizobium TaxID=2631580 RepID=UPI00247A705E|nr:MULTISPECIES: hypothetical protein [unclassified Bradyrhizobium]WGR72811.1 hypothetical protein MTX24_07895 [Bradyrhizobium sp. ISRA426]WGR77646.1 hypothetical protein MTX21_32850 [Bradyrhizobium sp. ISRA430]WGR88051.1 hypothetical protein MTX25_07900 [Bradyrhizobium sp. ISRA432]